MSRKKRVSGRADLDPAEALRELKGVDPGSETLRQRLRSLLGEPAQAIPLLLRQFESDDEEALAFATAALRALDDPSIIPGLLGQLRSPHVDDLAKGLLLNLLEHYGFDTHDPSLVGASFDFSAVLKGRSMEQETG